MILWSLSQLATSTHCILTVKRYFALLSSTSVLAPAFASLSLARVGSTTRNDLTKRHSRMPRIVLNHCHLHIRTSRTSSHIPTIRTRSFLAHKSCTVSHSENNSTFLATSAALVPAHYAMKQPQSCLHAQDATTYQSKTASSTPHARKFHDCASSPRNCPQGVSPFVGPATAVNSHNADKKANAAHAHKTTTRYGGTVSSCVDVVMRLSSLSYMFISRN